MNGRRVVVASAALVAALGLAGCGKSSTEPAEPRSDAAILALKPAGTNALVVKALGYGSGSIALSEPGLTCATWDWEDAVHYAQVCWAFLPVASASVTVTAAPTNGSRFTGWGAGPCTGSTDASCTVPMDRDRIVSVGFWPGGAAGPKSEYALSVHVLGFVDGEITAPPGVGLVCQESERTAFARTCMASVPAATPATQVTLTATPTVPGTGFAGWGGSCSGAGACTVTMDRDRSVTASFARPSVPQPPAVASFSAGPATILPGGSSTLSWNVQGATSVTIDQGVGAVTGSSVTVSPAATTTYTLTATNAVGTTIRTASVTVTAGIIPVRLAAHTVHSAEVRPDGTLWAWGSNSRGEIGDGTRVSRYVPVLVGSGFSAVALGFYHSIALKTDGTVWTWGWNGLGTLGDGTLTDSSRPVMVGSGFSAVAAGEGHSFALRPDGSLWGWGYNGFGQVGDGTTSNRATPVFIGSGFARVAPGYHHTVAIKADGTLWSWGENLDGQLGDGGPSRATPAQVGTDSDWATAAASWYHTMALKQDGTLWAWGRNSSGQLGDGTAASHATPVLVGGGYSAVAVGLQHTVGLRTDGTLLAWGSNTWGQLGDGTTVSQSSPVLVGTGFTSVVSGSTHVVALRQDGTLWSWGSNTRGQLGDGTTTQRSIPGGVGVTSSDPPVATTLVFDVEPPFQVAYGVTLDPPIRVAVLDQYGAPFTEGSYPVALSLTGTFGVFIGGSATVDTALGLATFSDLVLQGGTPQSPQFVASSPGLGSATSGRFTLEVAPAGP